MKNWTDESKTLKRAREKYKMAMAETVNSLYNLERATAEEEAAKAMLEIEERAAIELEKLEEELIADE